LENFDLKLDTAYLLRQKQEEKGTACGGTEFTWTAATVIEFVSESEII